MKYQCVAGEEIIFTPIDQRFLNLLNNFDDKVSALYAFTSKKLRYKQFKDLQSKGMMIFFGAKSIKDMLEKINNLRKNGV